MNPYPHTIVCLTFKPQDEPTLRRAGALAKTFGARLLLLEVDNSIPRKPSVGYQTRRLTPYGSTEALLEGANHERYVLSGDASIGVCEFAKEHDADLVVVANDFESGALDALGPESRKVVENLSCSVMIVKDPSNDSKDATARPAEISSDDCEAEFPVSTWLLEHVNKSVDDVRHPASKSR